MPSGQHDVERNASQQSDAQQDFSVVALVPMRHQSERVPGKNYRQLAGRPLYAYILESLSEVARLREIVVDTDSPIIREGVSRSFPHVRIIERPEHLRGGEVPINAIIAHDIEQVGARYYLQTHSTNPLLTVDTIEQALQAFMEAFPEHDSLMSVTPYRNRLWTAAAEPVNHDPQILIRTQDLPPLYEENSCIYIFEAEVFRHRLNRIGRSPLLFPIPAGEAYDIDEEIDFQVTECLMRNRDFRSLQPDD